MSTLTNDTSPATETPTAPHELRARRRAARIADNRADILDAAERTFADRGLEGSLRDIGRHAGFSTAALYKYFDNKQHLFAETLSRRGVELLDIIERAAAEPDEPMEKLHAIVDGAVGFFETYPDFRRMLRHVRQADLAIPAVVAEYTPAHIDDFTRVAGLMLRIVEDGQSTGAIRDGAASALLHFYMTLVYEHVFLAAPDNPGASLTGDQFHELVDGALRAPATRTKRSSRPT